MHIDRVEYELDGGTRTLSKVEFLGLPLFERVRALMEKRLRFYAGQLPVPSDVALFVMRKGQGLEPPGGPGEADRIFASGTEHVLGTVGGLVVCIWRRTITQSLLQRLELARADIAFRKPCGVLHLVEDTAKAPTAAVLEKLRQSLAMGDQLGVPGAVVIPALSGTLHGVGAALGDWAVGNELPLYVGTNVIDGLRWLGAQPRGEGLGVQHLTAAIGQMRRLGLSGEYFLFDH